MYTRNERAQDDCFIYLANFPNNISKTEAGRQAGRHAYIITFKRKPFGPNPAKGSRR